MSDFEEDLSNVMGSFISMELDYIEKNSNELEEVTKERDLYKEVIEEVRGFIEKHILATETEEVLLQILDKVKENK